MMPSYSLLVLINIQWNVMHIINHNIFSKQELETNFAFNIFDIGSLQICEGRIITSFYFNDHDIINKLL